MCDFVFESLIICYAAYKCLELYLNYQLTIKKSGEEGETHKKIGDSEPDE